MITVWNGKDKYLTPLIKAPLVQNGDGLYHIPIMKIPDEGTYDVYEYENFLGEQLNAGKVPIYSGAPRFDLRTRKFEVTLEDVCGWVVGYDIIDEAVWVKVLPNGPAKELLLTMFNGSTWLDVIVPYLIRSDSGVGPNHIVQWCNLIFIGMTPQPAMRDLITGD